MLCLEEMFGFSFMRNVRRFSRVRQIFFGWQCCCWIESCVCGALVVYVALSIFASKTGRKVQKFKFFFLMILLSGFCFWCCLRLIFYFLIGFASFSVVYLQFKPFSSVFFRLLSIFLKTTVRIYLKRPSVCSFHLLLFPKIENNSLFPLPVFPRMYECAPAYKCTYTDEKECNTFTWGDMT